MKLRFDRRIVNSDDEGYHFLEELSYGHWYSTGIYLRKLMTSHYYGVYRLVGVNYRLVSSHKSFADAKKSAMALYSGEAVQS